MLWVIMAIVIAVWLIGLIIGLAGNLIHFLLIIALAILIYNLLAGRRIG
ncbi:MAG: lmo0937 family membrane protein [Chloroflexia bacterium]|nr:lmo0937 family membrane protein [Chloroflexia bacterium]